MWFCCRALIYPFLIRGGKPTPFVSFALAFVFCIYNGYMQIRYLSHYAHYPANWATHPYFITGTGHEWLSNRRVETWTFITRLYMFLYVFAFLSLCSFIFFPPFPSACSSLICLPFNSLHSCGKDYFVAGQKNDEWLMDDVIYIKSLSHSCRSQTT